jgi:hypothetical protein
VSALGMKFWDFLSQKPNRTCERCGLLTPKEKDECVHCAKLDENQLDRLSEKFNEEKASNLNIGNFFFILSLIVVFLFSLTFFM